MQVLKFGGTSIGSASAIKGTVGIISATDRQRIIVFSAFSGITNLLTDINSSLILGKFDKAKIALEAIAARHTHIIDDLFERADYRNRAVQILNKHIAVIQHQIDESLIHFNQKEILAQGELLSSHIIQTYFQELNLPASIIDALDYMYINDHEEPDYQKTTKRLSHFLQDHSNQFIITQGYLCTNHLGAIDNLKRGGSDYSAAIIGVALGVEEIQIWTDIDGLHNNDPRYVADTSTIHSLSFEEAAELAYFGAKILHPQSILPAKEANIPVLLKNTFEPSKAGTIIKKQAFTSGVRAIAAKDAITSIKIKSYRMLMAYGFLKNVFEVFEAYKTPIDVITTSEVAVSLTIDNNRHLEIIVDKLRSFGEVIVEDQLSIICLVGYFPPEQVGISTQVLTALDTIPIRMISFGGSLHNISIIVRSEDKIEALNKLHQHIFETSPELIAV
jgi:aspartate kinase